MPFPRYPRTADQPVFMNLSRWDPQVDDGGNVVCRRLAGLIVLANFVDAQRLTGNGEIISADCDAVLLRLPAILG